MIFNKKLVSTAIVALLTFEVTPVMAASIRLTGATGSSCNYSAIEADSNGNMTVVCSDNTPSNSPVPNTQPRIPSSTRAPTIPAPSSALDDIKRWNYAFETINNIPHNYKDEPVSKMSYFKVIQANKPGIIHLPTTW